MVSLKAGFIASSLVLAVQEVVRVSQLPASTSYTMPELLALLAGVSAAIGVFITGIVQIITAVRTTAAIKENTAITQATLTKTAVIEGHVNSEKTSDAKTIEFQLRENQMLRDQLAEKDRIAGLLAQAAATMPMTAQTATPVLAQIEKNTDAIEKNTAKTDATVTELKKER